MVSLVEHGRITTTVEKAKELRRHIEKAITQGKKEGLATRRNLISKIANSETVNTIMTDLSSRFKTRPGGYTRIIKIGRRPGDTAEMAFIEFVDFDYTKAPGAEVKSEAKAGKKKSATAGKEGASAVAKDNTKKKAMKLLVAKQKAVKKIQKKSRQASRA